MNNNPGHALEITPTVTTDPKEVAVRTRKSKPKRTVPPALVSQIMREMGRKGGKKRLTSLTDEQRTEAASHAAKARWAKRKDQQ